MSVIKYVRAYTCTCLCANGIHISTCARHLVGQRDTSVLLRVLHRKPAHLSLFYPEYVYLCFLFRHCSMSVYLSVCVCEIPLSSSCCIIMHAFVHVSGMAVAGLRNSRCPTHQRAVNQSCNSVHLWNMYVCMYVCMYIFTSMCDACMHV